MNEWLFVSLNSFAGVSPALDTLIVFIASYLPWLLILGVLLFLFRERFVHPDLLLFPSRAHARELALIFFTALGAWFLVQILKELFGSSRPFEVLSSVTALIEKSGMDSFPSGHATFFSALAVGLYFYHRRLGLIYGVGALLIGISRIVAGVHWPLDILVGFVLGGLVAFGVWHLVVRSSP